MDCSDSVFQEIITWEEEPCKELNVQMFGETKRETKQIMLYGPTQVGKTTLIMNIMGVLFERREELAEILRGGSKTGNAATSTAIIYNKWDNENFGLATTSFGKTEKPKPERFDKEAFKKKIIELNEKNRKALSDKGKDYTDIFHYYIPSHYFEQRSEDEKIQLIDFPGFGEKNDAMRNRANIMISSFTNHADAVIAVVKSNNILKLDDEYHNFLDNFPKSRIIIVASFAVKESAEVKNWIKENVKTVPQGEAEEKEIWLAIAKCIKSTIGEISLFSDGNEEQRVFPVELDEYLEEFYPMLRGVFRHSNTFLREQLQRVQAKTSFSAYEEILSARIKNINTQNTSLEKYIEEEQGKITSLKKKIGEVSKKYAFEKDGETMLKPLHEELKNKESILATFEEDIKASKKGYLIGGEYIKSGIYKYMHPTMEKEEAVCATMQESLNDWFLVRHSDPEYNKLRGELLVAGRKIIHEIDTSDLLKKRDKKFFVPYFGDNSVEYVNGVDDETVKKIHRRMKAILSDWKKKNIDVLGGKIKEKESQILLAKKISKSIKDEIEEIEDNVNTFRQKIEKNIEESDLYKHQKENVRAIFVKHFFIKKKELEERIANASSPQMKAALLIVLSTIYRKMKQHIEAEELKNE